MRIDELETAAAARLDPDVHAFLSGAAGDGLARDGNTEAFRRYRLRPRVLRGVDGPQLATTLLGAATNAPFGIGPLPRLGRVGGDGERDVAERAAEAGICYCAPTNAGFALEELAVAGAPQWFQLYPHRDRAITDDLVDRAVAASYDAIVLTADRPVESLPRALHPEGGSHRESIEEYPNLARYGGAEVLEGRHAPRFEWTDLERMCARVPVPVVVKGVLDATDAVQATARGARAVWVSNHGGRLLDRALAALDALPAVREAVADDVAVYVDGGVRRASDVVTALALGADAVFLARPVGYALGLEGAHGVGRLLETLRADVATVMALVGAASVDELVRELVVPERGRG